MPNDDDNNQIKLSREDQIAFAEALINPPEPSDQWRASAKRHAELFGKSSDTTRND